MTEQPKLFSPNTAINRGYIGTWFVQNGRLFLVRFKGYIEQGKEVDINFIFPEKFKVFARWFDGNIKIPQGQILLSYNSGYCNLYEYDICLNFKSGRLISTSIIDNFVESVERKANGEDEDPFARQITP